MKGTSVLWKAVMMAAFAVGPVRAQEAGDLAQIRERNQLRHLGIPYAHFNTGTGEGLSVELMQRFADFLGVEYVYVPTEWSTVIGDLTGTTVKPTGDDVERIGTCEVKGDVIANGFTILPWREKVVAFSKPTFPTQVWLVVPSESPVSPIEPTGDEALDILATKQVMEGLSVLGKAGTCLDPSLYDVSECGAEERNFSGGLNDLAPALLQGEADTLLLDVPDSLVALVKWPGRIKVIGPMSEQQEMGVAFRQESQELLNAFNGFLRSCMADGSYVELVRKYYPDVFSYYPVFFQ
ncbi:MAG: transporter substrate-binding domain-containing protein [Spartobacteria bacterium]|nr:transporter substrate-binding domain-containing protein [Spartobacteria bacterium]